MNKKYTIKSTKIYILTNRTPIVRNQDKFNKSISAQTSTRTSKTIWRTTTSEFLTFCEGFDDSL